MHLTVKDLSYLEIGSIVFEAAVSNQVRRLQYIGMIRCLATRDVKHTFISDYLVSTLLISADNPERSIPITHARLFYTEKEANERLIESKRIGGLSLLPNL